MDCYKKECINCIKACSDPEIGYTCSMEAWDYFNNAEKCPNYKIDKEFLRNNLEEFIKKVE